MKCPNCSTELKPKTRFCPSCGTNVELITAGNLVSDSDPKIAALERALGNKYRILRKVGSGGFADVYLGEHTQLGRNVAIKILRGADDEEMIERFRREARAAAKLSHPNIIDIYDVGDSDSIYYFVMKYIPGDTLAQKMRREKKITPGTAIDITKQIVDALAYAHDRGVVHRDIKPANVLLDEFGKPVLMDFGIARMAFVGQLTRTGTLMGTPHYLPPEQPLGKPVDGRSDIYSLGIMFFEMLSGRVPFHDDAAIALIYKHINEQPPPLTSIAPEIAPELADVVHRMIEKSPDNRYQSAHDLYDALEALSTIYPARSTPGRRSTPGLAKDTERLILLAEEHLQQHKFPQALELLGTILQRKPDDKQVLQKRDHLVESFLESIKSDIEQKEFHQAWKSITELKRFMPNDPRLAELIADLEREEQASTKEKEYQAQIQAAQTALKHDNALMAVEHLTKALTIQPSSEEARTLLRDARAAYDENRRKAEYTNAFDESEYHFSRQSLDEALAAVQRALKIDRTNQAIQLEEKIHAALKERAYRESEERNITNEIDHLCEQLNFKEAVKLLDSLKSEWPILAKTLASKVERNNVLYGKFVRAQELREAQQIAESQQMIQEFLDYPLPYEFQAFYGLRKQAEELLKSTGAVVSADDIDQLLKKADTFSRMGQFNQARQICFTVLERDPENAKAQAKLEELNRVLGTPEIDTDELLRQIEMTSTEGPGTEPGVPIPQTVQYEEPRITLIPPTPPAEPVAARPFAPPAAAPAPARPSPLRAAAPSVTMSPFLMWGLGGVAALVILAMLLFLFWPSDEPVTVPQVKTKPPIDRQKQSISPAPVPAQTVSVSIDVRPWAEIEITGNGLTQPVRGMTPVRVPLAPGEYSIACSHPDFSAFTETIRVSDANRSFRLQFPQMNPQKVVDTLLR